jgi:hypothetical protein
VKLRIPIDRVHKPQCPKRESRLELLKRPSFDELIAICYCYSPKVSLESRACAQEASPSLAPLTPRQRRQSANADIWDIKLHLQTGNDQNAQRALLCDTQ